MRAPKCRVCGSEHWGSVCAQTETAKKSTAARKDVRRNWKPTEPHAESERAEQSQLAGTQALPVDTSPASSPSGKASGFGPDIAGSNPAEETTLYAGGRRAGKTAKVAEIVGSLRAQGENVVDLTQKRPPGRPRIHPDRKAYKAQKERERRAKLKAQKEAGK